MPFDEDGGLALATSTRVEPSAAAELFWAFLYLTRKRHPQQGRLAPHLTALRADQPELIDRAREFWGDGLADYAELFVLAERSGTLDDDEIEPFLDRLDETARAGGEHPGLTSETEAERHIVVRRLDRLRADAALRERYARLLGDVWDVLRPDWEGEGRRAVQATARSWRTRLEDGLTATALLPVDHIGRQERWSGIVEEAAARGTLSVAPLYFLGGRGHLIEVHGRVQLGIGLDPAAGLVRRRERAEGVATRLKVLSDGTRVALLTQLHTEKLSITELATLFSLSQPTVSTHVRLLREAGLLEAHKNGGRTCYSAPAERMDRLFGEVRDLLADACAG